MYKVSPNLQTLLSLNDLFLCIFKIAVLRTIDL
jgi:hypothetical protein